jgi:raffinose/stachyose/melibiose transport system permease protein
LLSVQYLCHWVPSLGVQWHKCTIPHTEIGVDHMQKTYKKYFALFALPTLLAFSIAFVIPFLLGIYLSFTEFTTVTNAKWVGIANYIKAFSDKEFLNALWFTVSFTVLSVITINVFAFIIAMLLTRGKKGTNIFRTIFFMPNLIGGIVLGYIWQLILNGILLYFGVTLTFDANYGFWGLVVLMNWQLIGYMMIIYIAGIQNVPKDIVEAAKIDGASRFQVLRNVTIPLVMPAITICLFLTLSNSFKLFDQNLALTAGAPSKQTTMLALDIFNTFYTRTGYEGVGQAKAVVFFVLVALIALIQLVITRRKEIEN